MDGEVEIVRELEPRCHVRVVVELRDDDLVARSQLASERARQREVERRHVLAEDDLVGGAAEKVRGRDARVRDERVAPHARLERPPRFAFDSRRYDAIASMTLVRRLRPRRAVEERPGSVEGGEAGAHGGDVERGDAHAPRLSWTQWLRRR